ncbi:MAG: Rieske (2Fe-2S) protein [Elusimicrobiales bacterium]|jgi:3-phenylpropionate/trans-cinnamate dioxygenase ferredoxin subunit
MGSGNWVKVLKEDALREGGMTAVFPKGLPVLLIRKAAGEIYALANQCAHMGCPLLRGSLAGYTLQCPCHDWRFDIRTGAFADAPELRLRVYEWKLESGHIWINI